MKIHGSHSTYTAPLLSQSSADSDDDTPFVLPDDQGSGQKTTVPSVSTASVANSISSGFWLNQSGSSTDATPTAASTDDTASTDDSSTADLSDDDILSEFAKWANMTPADKVRAQYLEQQNLTEDQFSQLPTDQQNAINDQIADQIKQQLGTGETGATGDDSDGDGAAVSLG
jgi:hypothetical protein